jgi:hypothetical protein
MFFIDSRASLFLVFLILCAIIPPVLGFFVVEYFRDLFAYIFMIFVDVGGLYSIVMFVAWLFGKREDEKEGDKVERSESARPVTRQPLQNMNAQTVSHVRFDARKNFCNIVLARLEHGYAKIDLTEKYWLVRKPQKWQGTPEEFRQMMREWDGDVFERKDGRKNSPYIIRSESRLRDKAHGLN